MKGHAGAQKFDPGQKSGAALPNFPVWIIDMHVFSCCNIASKETKDCQKEGDKFNNIIRTYNHVEGKNEGKTVQGSF
jgi:hypothetical protein